MPQAPSATVQRGLRFTHPRRRKARPTHLYTAKAVRVIIAIIAAVCTPITTTAIGKELLAANSLVGEALKQMGINAGISIRPAPWAFAIKNDHRKRPIRLVCIPIRRCCLWP